MEKKKDKKKVTEKDKKTTNNAKDIKDTKKQVKETGKNQDTKKAEENQNDLIIDPEVIASIVQVVIDKLPHSDTVGNIFGAFSNKNKSNKGIKVDLDEKSVKIDINIIVDYGMRIPDVAFEIQSKIKKEVENMTDIKVTEVNVHVQGIRDPQQAKIDKAKEEQKKA